MSKPIIPEGLYHVSIKDQKLYSLVDGEDYSSWISDFSMFKSMGLSDVCDMLVVMCNDKGHYYFTRSFITKEELNGPYLSSYKLPFEKVLKKEQLYFMEDQKTDAYLAFRDYAENLKVFVEAFSDSGFSRKEALDFAKLFFDIYDRLD